MLEGLIIVSILAASALAAAAVFWTQRNALARERDAIAADRDELETLNAAHLQKLEAQQSELSDLKSDLARIEEREKALQESFAQAQKQAENTFKALAGDTLKANNEQFFNQAKARLEPINKVLDEYRKLLREIEDKRGQAYSKLSEQVGALHTSQKDLQAETANLVRALRRPEGRGRWGELQMQRLFELAGMTERIDYDEQASVDAKAGGKLRPDYTVRLPNGRAIVIDAKTPLDAYLDAAQAPDEASREAALDRHARHVKDMAQKLSQKAYQDAIEGSPEFVVMFIPGEAMLYAAAHRDPSLIEQAMEKQVILATPTILVALLKTVAMGWREQSISENAKKISAAGQELYDRLATMFSHLANLHNAIDKTNEHYNKLVGSLERNVLPQARRIEDLHAAGSKPVPQDLPEIEINPRALSVPESLLESSDAPESD